ILLALLGFGLLGTSLGAQAAPNQNARCLTPDTVIVRGTSRVSEQAAVAAAGIRVGATLNFPTIQRAIRDLFSTGDFDHVTAQCGLMANDTRAALVFTVVERPLLGDVSVVGPQRLSADDVEDRVDLLLGR